MRGKQLVIAWAEADTAEALREQYRKESEGEVRSRLHGLWLLRTGWSLRDVAAAVGVQYRTVQRWVGWYRQGGVAEVCAHRAGGYGQPSWLTPEQEGALAEEAAKGTLVTAEEARQWVIQRFGVTYRPSGIYRVLRRVGCRPKVPRPVHVKADREAQDAWKKGGAPRRSMEAGVRQGQHLAWADEMRVGLVSTVRRVWAPRGVKVCQRVQMVREWRYLVVAVDVQAGRLWWCWTEAMSGEATASVVQGWQQHTDLEAVVWDGAPSHRSELVQDLGFPLVQQPSYAPELNPVERLFEELRRAVEGKIYAALPDKVATIEAELRKWDVDPERVKRLVHWTWIRETLNQLPRSDHLAA